MEVIGLDTDFHLEINYSYIMSVEEILLELESLSSDATKKHYIKSGAGNNLFGVKRGDIRKIAKRLKSSHELGLELWNTGNIDARFLAILIFKPTNFTEDDLESIVKTFTFSEVADWFCMYVLKKLNVEELRNRWIEAEEPMVARVGWFLMAVAIKDITDMDYIVTLLDRIEEEMITVDSLIQWTMNNTLVNIGIYHKEFRDRALNIGEKLGIYKEYPVTKGCTSPYAPIWINEMVKREEKR